jgi:predicted outer membrane protein
MTFVKWGMAAVLALAISPAYADDQKSEAQKEMTQAQQEAQEQKAEAQKDASEAKAEAQKDTAEANREAQEKTAEANRDAQEKMTEAEREAREKTGEAQKDMQEEGREVRTSDDRTTGSATGATAATQGDADKAPLSATAKQVLQKLHASSQMEVGMARLAKDKAQNEKVKDLAEKIEDDHSDFAEKASEIAREKNVDLAAHDQMSKNRKHVEQMEKMQGASFDRHFADMMAKEHKKEIAELRTAQTKLRASKADEDVAELVDDALPKMEEHQKMAMEAQAAVGSSAQRQGRTPSSTDTRATPSSSAATDNADTQGNNARPRDAVHGTENTEGTPTGSTTSDGSSDKKY